MNTQIKIYEAATGLSSILLFLWGKWIKLVRRICIQRGVGTCGIWHPIWAVQTCLKQLRFEGNIFVNFRNKFTLSSLDRPKYIWTVRMDARHHVSLSIRMQNFLQTSRLIYVHKSCQTVKQLDHLNSFWIYLWDGIGGWHRGVCCDKDRKLSTWSM